MLAIPQTHDQPAIAARIHRSGCGLILNSKQITVDRVRTGLGELIAKGSYREAAERLQAGITRAGGTRVAVKIVESVLRKAG